MRKYMYYTWGHIRKYSVCTKNLSQLFVGEFLENIYVVRHYCGTVAAAAAVFVGELCTWR